MSSEISID